jgi:hypothetical protein
MLTDRVRAVGTVWLGQTTGCGQCHDHKFDPFTMRDFYSLGAFFADIQEPIIGRREDGMLVISPDQQRQLDTLESQLAEARKQLDAVLPQLDAAQQQWESDIVAGNALLAELQPDSKPSPQEKQNAEQVAAALKKEAKDRNGNEKQLVQTYFRTRVSKMFQAEQEAVTKAQQQRDAFQSQLPKCLVSVSTTNKRTVRILPRGNWMDSSGEVVQPALPQYLSPAPVEDRELNRLDLAQWLVARDNPLTARVFANRLWKQFFGIGLSRVLDDLGAQGEPPANPLLLDWLACEFMDSGWDIKHLVRTIVTSQTYQQVSTASPALLARDPENRELARQSRYRLDAELVRDNALAISGLLVPKIGGPSVKPYQPDGYWENLNFPARNYQADTGENQYRRGLYTWWQRSFPHPAMIAFDAPSREECCAERSRSNIPQQALVLLNDPSYVEAARAFAARLLAERPAGDESRMTWAWQLALQREPTAAEAATLRTLLEQQLAAYRAEPAAAEALLKTGQTPMPSFADKIELAAWTHVARVLLNLHETVTRE